MAERQSARMSKLQMKVWHRLLYMATVGDWASNDSIKSAGVTLKPAD